jgi:hypothetical protein
VTKAKFGLSVLCVSLMLMGGCGQTSNLSGDDGGENSSDGGQDSGDAAPASCGTGPACSSGQYCHWGSCYDLPQMRRIPTQECVDVGQVHPAPEVLLGYEVTGRPDAQVHVYALHVSCFDATDIETSESAVNPPRQLDALGSFLFEMSNDVPMSDCESEIFGQWETWAVVDGYETTRAIVTYHNPICAMASHCEQARRHCPACKGPGCDYSGGFWDPGFAVAAVRTAYDAVDEGTTSNPITLSYPFGGPGGCYFSDAINGGCVGGATVYGTESNYWSQNLNPGDKNFWILELNNEPAFDSGCNSGPPDLSLSRSLPLQGLMGFRMDDSAQEGFNRAHLALDLSFQTTEVPCGVTIPFLSIGAHETRGNGKPVAWIAPPGHANPLPEFIHFTAKVEAFTPPQCDACAPVIVFRMWAVAEWGGVPRMLFVDFFHEGLDSCSDAAPGGDCAGAIDWNWPIEESYLFPGADLAFLDAEDVDRLCGFPVERLTSVGQEVEYDLNLGDLFHCASSLDLFLDPMPPEPVPVRGIHWVDEGQGESGLLWMSLHGVNVHP